MKVLAHQTNFPETGQTRFFVVGGALPSDAPSYIVRQADADLLDGLLSGQLCYVLTPRQMGKSSLMVRMASQLRDAGVAVAIIDLPGIGLNLTTEQWYFGLLLRIGEELDLEEPLEDYWGEHLHLPPLHRWLQALKEVVLARLASQTVIFIDEIDATLGLAFSTDEFFASIREMDDRRTDDLRLARLTFCFLGVANATDLIADSSVSPFAVGRRIELPDFTERQAMLLAEGFAGDAQDRKALLRRVLHWTGGQPYLTQRLCQAVADRKAPATISEVDRICSDLFLAPGAMTEEINLASVRSRLLNCDCDSAALLMLYDRVQRGKFTQDDRDNPLVNALLLSGIVRAENGSLHVRNRIYEQVFNRQWLNDQLPSEAVKHLALKFSRSVAIIGFLSLMMMLVCLWRLNQHDRAAADDRVTADRTLAMATVSAKTADAVAPADMIPAKAIEKSPAKRAASNADDDFQTSLLVWETLKESNDPLTFEAYLETNPPKDLEARARARLQTLRAAAASRRAGIIRGQIFDIENREPLCGAIVRANSIKAEHTMLTNSDGQFLFGRIAPGSYTITIKYEGYETKLLSNFMVRTGMITRFDTTSGGLRKIP